MIGGGHYVSDAKDLADIARLVESFPDLAASLPESIRERL